MDDAATIRRSLDAPAAFGVVFDRHFEAVYAFAARRVGTDLAEEVAAEAFARAFAARRRYDGAPADALPWLLGIARFCGSSPTPSQTAAARGNPA